MSKLKTTNMIIEFTPGAKPLSDWIEKELESIAKKDGYDVEIRFSKKGKV